MRASAASAPPRGLVSRSQPPFPPCRHERLRSAARKAGCDGSTARAALLSSTDLTSAAAAAVASSLDGLEPGTGPRALDHAPPSTASLSGVSWRVSLAVGSSVAGECGLPLAHVSLRTADADGAARSDTLELTLPELRALRAEVAAAIAAVDRA